MQGRFTLVIGLAALIWACGNGVPQAPDESNNSSGTTCMTDSDCSNAQICVNSTCVPLAIPGVDAGSLNTPTDSGGNQMPQDSGMTMMNYGDFCTACTNSSQCGGSTNFCLPQTGGGAFCGIECSTTADCPSGASCEAIGNGSGGIAGHNCYPAGGTCNLPPPDAGPPPVDAGHPEDAGPPDAGPPDAGPPDAGMCTTTSWANTWNSWFLMTCATGCHHSSSEITKSWVVQSGNQRLQSGSMPPGGGVSSSEKQEIQKWINCGAP